MNQPLFRKLFVDRPIWGTEEEVRKGWLKHLENDLGITFHAERGRNDASYNQVIIEFKDKGLFKGSTESRSFKEAIYDRLAKYIPRRAKEEGLSAEEYIGIAIDGDHVCFAFYRGGKIVHRHLLPFNEASVDLVVQACRDAKRRAVTAENLVEDFGLESTVGTSMMAALASELAAHLKGSSNNKIRMLFEEWRTLFGQVADLTRGQETDIRQSIPIKMELVTKDAVAALLFVIHTYNAFVMKMLAAEIVSELGLTSYPDFCEHLLGLDDDNLLARLNEEIERSALFEAARIRGFVEEAVFSWYADQSLSTKGRGVIANAIRSLVIQLSLYRMDDLGAARSRDVLKCFYQALVPESLRKALGEFYTPDWLVDIACDRTGVKDWLNIRVLDPTCGSGSFLLEVVRRKRSAATSKNLDSKATLSILLDTVWGFDLNPLAVQSSRVNFLIAVADLVAETKAEMELPILLADAVYSPARAPNIDEDVIEYRIGSTQSDLKVMVPAALAFDRARLDRVFVVMAESVESDADYGAAENILIKRGCLNTSEAETWRTPLSETYEQVLNLHRQNWNGIWFRIVRNFFWSAAAGKFDLVVGNPPWVRWSSLPEHYRNRIKPTCERYAIFSETPFHGGNELDISGMITYTVGDKWLKIGGTLVFVITQTHFQSPSSQGFRSFKIDANSGFLPVEIDDLKKLRPFPKVANKTAIMRLEKVAKKKPKYPLPYRVWEKAEGYSGTIPENADKASVLARVIVNKWEATPVAGGNSPWAILPKGRFKDMAAIQGESSWIAGRKGVTCDLNGVLLVWIVDENKADGLVKIKTRPEAGRIDIGPAKTFWVEPDLLYPLLKGAADFSACHVHVEDELYVFVPNRGINRQDYEAAEMKVNTLIKTKAYFKSYKTLLKGRSTYKLRQNSAPEYVIYNVGNYTFAPYKVVWAELSSIFEAAVVTNTKMPLVGERPYVPDHKIYFADFTSEDDAHYVCALLNSTLVREYVQSHTIQIQVSNIFKHLNLPPFDAAKSDHLKVAILSKDAHGAKTYKKRSDILAVMDVIAEQILRHGSN
jgi:hypothetical protein